MAAGAGGWRAGAGPLPQARSELADVLQVEGHVRRSGCVGGPTAEGAGGRGRSSEADGIEVSYETTCCGAELD